MASQYDLYVVGQHGVLCEVKWRRFVALAYSNKIESVGLRKYPHCHCLIPRKWCHNKAFVIACPTSRRGNSWHRHYVTVTMYINFFIIRSSLLPKNMNQLLTCTECFRWFSGPCIGPTQGADRQIIYLFTKTLQYHSKLEMWANAQRDGRPAEYRWRPLFNAAKFGWRPLLDAVQ